MGMERKSQNAQHHTRIILGRVPCNGQRMIVIIMAIHVGNL